MTAAVMWAGRRGGLPARTAGLDDIRALREAGHPAEARVAAVALVASAVDDLDAVLVRNELGLALKALGAYAAARRQYETAMRITMTAIDPGDSDIAATLLHNLAGIRFVLDDPTGAARCARRGLAMRRRLFGADDLSALLDESNYAPILIALGELDAARHLLERLLAEFPVRLGPDDIEVAMTLTNLGALDSRRGDWATARHHIGRAAEIKERWFGADSPELIVTLANLAVVTDHAGDRRQSMAVLARVRRIARRALATDHPLRDHVERL